MHARERERVREVLRGLLPELRERGVVALEWSAGEDWAGDPAVWIRVVLPADAGARGLWAFDNRRAIREAIREAFARAGLEDLFVYVTFRLADEEAPGPDMEYLAAA